MKSRILGPCSLLLVVGCRSSAPPQPPPDGASPEPIVEQEGAEPEPGADPNALPPIDCQRPADFGPVVVTAEQYARRYAATATKFSEVGSTREHPAEECGIGAGVELLLALTCDDGSKPFASFQEAHMSRAGNVGSGGRCGSIIDLYVVPCPEAQYEVFIDSYICADAAMFQ